MKIKKYEGCAVDGHNGIYTAQIFAKRYPELISDAEDLAILLAGPDNADYLDVYQLLFPVETAGKIYEINESGDILEYSLIDSETITIGQLNELAKSVNPGGMSVYENQFGYADIAQLGENCLCRVSLANTGIVSADLFFEMDDWYSIDENLQTFIEQELTPKLREEFEESHVILTLPAYYASYLINDDPSGLTDNEQLAIDKFILGSGVGLCVGCSDDSWFAGSSDLGNLGGDVMEFYFERGKQ
jgi:hypothetical protein